MFTYLDPTVRERLIGEGKLIRINAGGQAVDARRDPQPGSPAISILGPIPLPLSMNGADYRVDWFAAVRHTELSRVQDLADRLRDTGGQDSFALLASSMAVNSVLVLGDRQKWKNPLIRVHSSCLTGDVFGSQRCECGPQLALAMDRIHRDEEGGMVIYMSGHEGRGIGLWAKAATYLLQDGGEDTYQANQSLGLPEDSRDFSDAASLLKYFRGNEPFRLLTNNPKKVDDLNAFGLDHITRVKHVSGVGEANRKYLAAKRSRGHDFGDDDIAYNDIVDNDIANKDTGDEEIGNEEIVSKDRR